MLPTKYCPVSIHTEYIKCNAQKAGLCKIDNTYYPLYHYHSHFISPKLLTIKVSNKFSLSIYIVYHSYTYLSIYLSIYLYIYIHVFVIPTFLGFHQSLRPNQRPLPWKHRTRSPSDTCDGAFTEAALQCQGLLDGKHVLATASLWRICRRNIRDVWWVSLMWIWCEFKRIRNDLSPKYLYIIYINIFVYVYYVYIYVQWNIKWDIMTPWTHSETSSPVQGRPNHCTTDWFVLHSTCCAIHTFSCLDTLDLKKYIHLQHTLY